jgi:hypothetical protein
MLERKIEFGAVDAYHASSFRATMSKAIAVPMMFLFLTREGSAFAQSIDPASAIRGSLGVSLANLSFSDHLGALSLFLNGGFALLCGAIAACFVARGRRDRRATFGHQRTRFSFLLSTKRPDASARKTGFAKRGFGG